MRKIYLIITLFLLSGCTKYIYIPVSSCTPPRSFDLPYSMVENLPANATTQDKLQALKVDYGSYRDAAKECKILLDAYRPPQPTTQK